MNEGIEEQAQKLIESLNFVKQDYIKTKDALAVSIRKDIVAAELKDMMSKYTDYETLVGALKVYVENMYKFKGE